MLLKKIKYLYQKKNRYLEAFLQDLIADSTGFNPYEIKLRVASKKDKTRNQFNYFEFSYQGIDYILKDDTLKMTYFEN